MSIHNFDQLLLHVITWLSVAGSHWINVSYWSVRQLYYSLLVLKSSGSQPGVRGPPEGPQKNGEYFNFTIISLRFYHSEIMIVSLFTVDLQLIDQLRLQMIRFRSDVRQFSSWHQKGWKLQLQILLKFNSSQHFARFWPRLRAQRNLNFYFLLFKMFVNETCNINDKFVQLWVYGVRL